MKRNYTIPSDNWEQQLMDQFEAFINNYTIPSDNWEQQRNILYLLYVGNYTIPSDNWEQQHDSSGQHKMDIIPYQAITGNNNRMLLYVKSLRIIPYQAITGNNNHTLHTKR